MEKKKELDVINIVNEAYKTITTMGQYDVVKGNAVIDMRMEVEAIPEAMLNYLQQGGEGCCFVFSSALMKLLHDQGIESYMVVTPEGNGIRSSLLYEADGKVYVANPVEDIEYFTEREIPFKDRKYYYGAEDATFFEDGIRTNNCMYSLKEFSEKFGPVRLLPSFYGNMETLHTAMNDEGVRIIAKPGEFWTESMDEVRAMAGNLKYNFKG